MEFSGTKRGGPEGHSKVLGRHPQIHRFQSHGEGLGTGEERTSGDAPRTGRHRGNPGGRNQILVEANKTLRSEIKKASKQLVRFQESRASQDRAISRIKQVTEQILGYMKELEAKIQKDKQQYEDEKKESAELERMVLDLEKICEAQENQILSLEERFEQFSFGKLEMDSLL
ncbi:hypothetical protein E2320_005740 [Naja naja]|nr:hypothetical protein E2320_005740 [Naja naja]